MDHQSESFFCCYYWVSACLFCLSLHKSTKFSFARHVTFTLTFQLKPETDFTLFLWTHSCNCCNYMEIYLYIWYKYDLLDKRSIYLSSHIFYLLDFFPSSVVADFYSINTLRFQRTFKFIHLFIRLSVKYSLPQINSASDDLFPGQGF